MHKRIIDLNKKTHSVKSIIPVTTVGAVGLKAIRCFNTFEEEENSLERNNQYKQMCFLHAIMQRYICQDIIMPKLIFI